MKQYLTSLFRGEKSFARLTHGVNEASRILQLGLLDHIVIGTRPQSRNSYFNFKESGVIR